MMQSDKINARNHNQLYLRILSGLVVVVPVVSTSFSTIPSTQSEKGLVPLLVHSAYIAPITITIQHFRTTSVMGFSDFHAPWLSQNLSELHDQFTTFTTEHFPDVHDLHDVHDVHDLRRQFKSKQIQTHRSIL